MEGSTIKQAECIIFHDNVQGFLVCLRGSNPDLSFVSAADLYALTNCELVDVRTPIKSEDELETPFIASLSLISVKKMKIGAPGARQLGRNELRSRH